MSIIFDKNYLVNIYHKKVLCVSNPLTKREG